MNPVVWLNAHQNVCNPLSHWDALHLQRAILDALPRDTCWLHEAVPEPAKGPSLVLVPGQHHATVADYAHINGALSVLERVVLIVHSDEASIFDWRQIEHPDLTFWISTPRMSVHEPLIGQARFFGEGAGPPVALPPVEKDLDVAWLGQDTHVRRHELVKVLQAMNSDRVLCEPSDGFMQGRPRAGYLATLARAKIAPCPSGAATTCSFRLFESIEAGCIPVVENFTPDGKDHRQWQLCYPHGLPFPVVDSWEELPSLVPSLLADFDRVSRACRDWWAIRQAEYVDWLVEDLALAR